eukprot:8339396-Lingulodinium_polyedra.AAC.1
MPLDILLAVDDRWGAQGEGDAPPAQRRRVGQQPATWRPGEGGAPAAAHRDHAAGCGRRGP